MKKALCALCRYGFIVGLAVTTVFLTAALLLYFQGPMTSQYHYSFHKLISPMGHIDKDGQPSDPNYTGIWAFRDSSGRIYQEIFIERNGGSLFHAFYDHHGRLRMRIVYNDCLRANFVYIYDDYADFVCAAPPDYRVPPDYILGVGWRHNDEGQFFLEEADITNEDFRYIKLDHVDRTEKITVVHFDLLSPGLPSIKGNGLEE